MIVLLALAGGVGAVARFLLDTAARARLGEESPTGIVVVNITGSFALGLLTGLVGAGAAPGDLLPVLGTGLLGGYTTFSTAMVDAVTMLGAGRRRAALATALGTLALSVGAAAAGLAAGGGVGHAA
jgi:CrcB protein